MTSALAAAMYILLVVFREGRLPFLCRLPAYRGAEWFANSENPAVLVDGGPRRCAVNVVNKTTYVYLADWIGLAFLLVRFGVQT